MSNVLNALGYSRFLERRERFTMDYSEIKSSFDTDIYSVLKSRQKFKVVEDAIFDIGSEVVKDKKPLEVKDIVIKDMKLMNKTEKIEERLGKNKEEKKDKKEEKVEDKKEEKVEEKKEEKVEEKKEEKAEEKKDLTEPKNNLIDDNEKDFLFGSNLKRTQKKQKYLMKQPFRMRLRRYYKRIRTKKR